jgi:hypothetical protein
MKNIKDFKKYNESFLNNLSIFTLGLLTAIKLIKWIISILKNRERKKLVNTILKVTHINSLIKMKLVNNRTNQVLEEKNAMEITDYPDRWYITMTGPLAALPNLRILKKEKQLIIEHGKPQSDIINLTEEEYQTFLKIIKSKEE